jgi:hypothetical protein
VKLDGKRETCGCETQSVLYGFKQVHMDGGSCPVGCSKGSYGFPCVLGLAKFQLFMNFKFFT